MLVYWLLVGVILQRGGPDEDFPLFIFAAILPWKWFDSTDPGRRLARSSARSG